jgi:hypothetical protein
MTSVITRPRTRKSNESTIQADGVCVMKIQSKQHGEKLVYFDAEFLPEVSPSQWYAPKKGNTFYCARNTKQNDIQTTLYLHQVV